MSDESDIELTVDGKPILAIDEDELFGVGVCPAGGKHRPAGRRGSITTDADTHEFGICTKCAGVVLVSLEVTK